MDYAFCRYVSGIIAQFANNIPFYSIPFHRFISGNEAHTDNTNIKQEDSKSVPRNDKNTENTKHTVKQSRQKMNVHGYIHT